MLKIPYCYVMNKYIIQDARSEESQNNLWPNYHAISPPHLATPVPGGCICITKTQITQSQVLLTYS
jgi:hypothetical protein